jgi:thiol-disulfide isomerase/thioredoxin
MKKAIVTAILWGIVIYVQAQSTFDNSKVPVIGKPCPEHFFKEIANYKKKTASISDFKGKWLILDFWAYDCSNCIASFPKLNKEQKEFGDKIQILLVTYGDPGNKNKYIFGNYQKMLELNVPCAFDGTFDPADSKIREQNGIFADFDIGMLPEKIIIDPQGIVRYRTSTINSEELAAILSGKTSKIEPSYPDHSVDKPKKIEYPYNNTMPYLTNGNGGPDSLILYRSLVTKWTKSSPYAINSSMSHPEIEVKKRHNAGRFEALGVDISTLYQIAYIGQNEIKPSDTTLYGKFWPHPILAVRDSSILKEDPEITDFNRYCYSLILPPLKSTKNYMMQIMQSDLKNYFGYDVLIETQKMPYWRVTVYNQKKFNSLITKGSPSVIKSDWTFYSGQNVPLDTFIKLTGFYSGLDNTGTPVLNETGYKGNIDIDVQWARNSFDVVKKALRQNGMDLVRGEKEMLCVVIRDPKQ